MSVSKEQNLNVCEMWMEVIQPFISVDSQRENWFIARESEEIIYEDAIDDILSVAKKYMDQEAQGFLNFECYDLVKKLVDKICHFRYDSKSYLKGVSEKELFADPEWISIIQSAQNAYQALELFKNEINHV